MQILDFLVNIEYPYVQVIDSFMSIAESCALFVISSDDGGRDGMQQHQNSLNRMETIFRPLATQPNQNVSLVEFKIGCVENMLEGMLGTIHDMKLQLQQTAVHISDINSVFPSKNPTTPVIARLTRQRSNSI